MTRDEYDQAHDAARSEIEQTFMQPFSDLLDVLDSDLYGRFHDQQALYSEAANGIDQKAVDVHGASLLRGYAAVKTAIQENRSSSFTDYAAQLGFGPHPGPAPGGSQYRWKWWYSRYLRSAEWASRRAAVMDRCGQICEGCRDNPASEVHHLTYDHAGFEFLFELVGVCKACHERLHEGRR